MPSKSDIVNMALGLINTKSINTIEPPPANDTVAIKAAIFYDVVRRQVLEDHVWNFAAKRAELSPETDAPLFGFSKAFPVPADYIRLVGLGEDEEDDTIPYVEESGKILCDEQTLLKMRYIMNVEDTTQFSPSFLMCLVYALASVYALILKSSATDHQMQAKNYETAMLAAKSINGQNSGPKVIDRSRLTAVRRALGTLGDPTVTS